MNITPIAFRASFPLFAIAIAIAIAIAMLCGRDAAAQNAESPAALQGIWKVSLEPAFPGAPTPDMFIKITPTHLVIRFKAPEGTLEMLDGAGEAVYKEAFTNGIRYFESPFYELKVNTATSPWQIDLTRDGKDGKKVVQLGLCELDGDRLKIDLGLPNGKRADNLEKRLGVSEAVRFTVIK